MNKLSPKKTGFFLLPGLFIAVILAMFDQFTKWVVVEKYLKVTDEPKDFTTWFQTINKVPFFITEQSARYETMELTSFLNLHTVWNRGISFGMLNTIENANITSILLIGFSIVISVILFVWMALSNNFKQSLAITMIIGGAIGNIIDRIRFGAVSDFIDLHISGFHWPTFNMADAFITIGAFILIYHMLLEDDKEMDVVNDN